MIAFSEFCIRKCDSRVNCSRRRFLIKPKIKAGRNFERTVYPVSSKTCFTCLIQEKSKFSLIKRLCKILEDKYQSFVSLPANSLAQ